MVPLDEEPELGPDDPELEDEVEEDELLVRVGLLEELEELDDDEEELEEVEMGVESADDVDEEAGLLVGVTFLDIV